MIGRLKASLTVFVALILTAVMTLLFTMSECIRLYELNDFGQQFTDMAVESAFSEYNPYLWSNYKILALDLGYGTDAIGPSIFQQKLLDYAKYNADIEEGSNFARLNPAGATTNHYSVLTDGAGEAVVMLGVKAAKDDLAAQIIDGIQGQCDAMNGIEKVPVESQAESGAKALEDAKSESVAKKANADNDDDPNTSSADYPEIEEVEDNPLDAFKVMKEALSKGFLSTVIDVNGVSDKEWDGKALPSKRSLNKGTSELSNGSEIADKALFIDYVLANYSRYDLDKKHDGMRYEVEHLIAGKESDSQNLAAVVGELLLIREAANYSTICNSRVLLSQAQGVAATLSSFNPPMEPVVEAAIIAAWAYIESVLDVRLLLSGGTVPIIKTGDQWTSDVLHLSSFLNVNAKAKQCQGGISYEKYLIGFLALKSNKTLGMRACDVMETALNSTEDYKNIKADNLMFYADVTMDYSADEMFLSLFDGSRGQAYTISKTRQISY